MATKSKHMTLAHCLPEPLMLSVAVRAKSKQTEDLRQGPFDSAALRSGRAGRYSTRGEGVYESSVFRFSALHETLSPGGIDDSRPVLSFLAERLLDHIELSPTL